MKRILLILTLIFTFGMVASAQSQPLTQFYLVEGSGSMGPSFRSQSEMARLLKKIGFKVSAFSNRYDDEMAEYTALKATRNGTTLTLRNGEDPIITINFATQREANEFVDSLNKCKYSKSGSLYSHPLNSLGKVYVRVKGRTIKLIFPFEMLPYNF